VKKSLYLALTLGAALALSWGIVLFPVARAQTSSSSSTQSVGYDLSKETQVQGTIQQIDNSEGRTPLGTHILVETSEGIVDAHLGALNKASFEALSLQVGQSVALTGMQESMDNGSVFLVRLLTTPSRIVILRNERGYPVRSLLPRGSYSSPAMMKGGS
jgi:hypothetical protein